MARAFIGLGSNLGDRLANLRMAVFAFDPEVVAVSPVYETDPVGGPQQDDFLNAVVQLDTQKSPHDLLAIAHDVEQRAGRHRVVLNGPRTLDVDILWIDGVALESGRLTVPHPRMWERRFVLAPLRDIAPEMVADETLDASVGEVRLVDTVVRA